MKFSLKTGLLFVGMLCFAFQCYLYGYNEGIEYGFDEAKDHYNVILKSWSGNKGNWTELGEHFQENETIDLIAENACKDHKQYNKSIITIQNVEVRKPERIQMENPNSWGPCKKVIAEAIEKHKKIVESKIIGCSLVSTIYNELLKANLIDDESKEE
jgi:hypothetical protein